MAQSKLSSMALPIKKAGVAGAGAMGLGIAQVLAQSGVQVTLFDVNTTALQAAEATIKKQLQHAVEKGKLSKEEEQATLSRLVFTGDIENLTGELIVEAIIEKLEPKKELFKKLEAINRPETILASNTSSIPITRIAAGLAHPERVAGLHFFNPAHVMKLVEVIAGAETLPRVVEQLQQLCVAVGKTPIICKDSPGFVVNRVARHFYVESLKLLEEQAATMENIDALMESAGFKMGPFKLMDLVGNDVNFSVTSSMYESFHGEPRFRPSRIQQQKVEAGYLGKKTGKGFYTYSR